MEYIENIVGKGENAGNQHFLYFPQYYILPFPKQISFFSITFIFPSANANNLSFGKDVT